MFTQQKPNQFIYNQISLVNVIATFERVVKKIQIKFEVLDLTVRGAVADMRYFARSKFSMSLVHKKNFSLIWQVVFRLA